MKSTPREKKPENKPKRTGRPRIDNIDWEAVDKLCALQCTGEEIAGFLKVDYDTLNARVKEAFGLAFSDYFAQKRGNGKVSLRRKQYEKALAGDTTMLIWLGKQYLGQKDQHGLTLNDMPSPFEEFTKAAKGDAPGWNEATEKPEPETEEEANA